MLRVGRIPYLNCEPFFHRLTGVELVDLIPRRLGEAMAAGELDAGPLSLMDYLRIESELTPLPYGIGCPTGARSVLVFSERPLAEPRRRPRRHHRRDLDLGRAAPGPARAPLRGRARGLGHRGGALRRPAPDRRSGDPARSPSGPPARHVTDLGLEWRDWTGPAVRLRAVGGGLPRARSGSAARFEQALDAALDRGMAALPEIAASRRDLGWTAAQIESYLRNFAFRLGPDEEKGAAEFVRLRAQLGPLPC